jgi:hypothetical protein
MANKIIRRLEQLDENEDVNGCDIDWESIRDMAKLMFLVYEYVEGWGTASITNMLQSLEANNSDDVDESELELLRGLQIKYPQAEVLQYLTNSAGLQCVVGKNPSKKHITVVFRGTDSFWDCLYDLFIVKRSLGKGVRVHRGFYNQLFHDDVYEKLKTLLTTQLADNPGWDVYITGHSLGASLSTLSGFLLAQAFPTIQFQVVAFASPKCGNAAFKAAFHALPNLHQYRICYALDCMTALPTIWYNHVGDNLWYDKVTKTWHYFAKEVTNNYYLHKYYNAYDHLGHNYLTAVTNDEKRIVKFHLPKD